jgi:hypothetical protein
MVAAAVLLTGCTGIPHSSQPQQVQPIGVDQPENDLGVTPRKNDIPRDIVQGFLDANGTGNPNTGGAFSFLTQQAKNHWNTSTVTIISDERVGVFNPDTDKVSVTGTEIGTLDPNGVYSPSLSGDGSGTGGTQFTATFAMKQVGGQWRIDTLRNGLIITDAEFLNYHQSSIYFFDVAEQHLVPEPRWSAAADRGDPDQDPLATFLMTQLFLGPRDSQQSAETTELPAQVTVTPTTVTIVRSDSDQLTKIEVPGAAQLNSASRDRLAAQIGQTLAQVSSVNAMEITDGGTPVSIPAAGGATFTSDVVTAAYVPATNPVGLYYVRNGAVFDESGTALPGPIGKGSYGLTTVALANRQGTSGLLVAGARGKDPMQQQLDIGTVDGQLITSKLPAGQLSRPDWVPGLREVWIGDGSALYRVLPSGAVVQVVVTTAGGKAIGRVTAVRLSPEGSRVALVLTPAEGNAQIWVGAVVRGAGVPQVNSLSQISPQGVNVTDVAWNDELKLFAVGQDVATKVSGIYEVQVDGSLWTAHGIVNLPEQPTSITASEGLVAAVSSGGTIWKQLGGSWGSPQGGDARGQFPVYSN